MVGRKKVSSKFSPRKKDSKQSRKQDTCFVIMPFGGDWFDTYYESIYLPAIEEAGLTPRRADNLFRPSAIINDIWALTNESKLILADLSEKNANVFYELGMAHALAKPAILVTESLDDVPFDLRSLRVIVYEKNRPDWGEVLKQKIKKAIKEVLASPLDAVLPTFIKVKETNTQPSASKIEKDLISLRQEMDLVRRQLLVGNGLSLASRVIRHSDLTSWTRFAKGLLSSGFSDTSVVHQIASVYQISVDEARLVVSRAKAEAAEIDSGQSSVDGTDTDNDLQQDEG